MLKKIIFGIYISIAATTASANGFPEQMGKIAMDGYINLPSPGSLILVKRNGEIITFSGNGRYMIRGAIYDMWNGGKRIHSLNEGKNSARRIRFNNMEKVLEDAATIDVGNGHGKLVLVFVDLSSEPSMKLLKKLKGIKGYRFKVVIMAAVDKESAKKAKGLMCLKKSNPEQAKNALLSGNISFVPDGECGKEALMKTLILAKMFGITRVPMLVAPNGEPLFGDSNNIEEFLKENSHG